MMDNSEEIARLINDASHNATAAVTRTLGQLQEGTQGVADAAKTNIARTLEDLHGATRTAIDESKQTAAATVADMLETHSMLRNDSTALFERLREANILLQEVLSGAHENMNAIEHTMVSRVSEFVAAMNDLNTGAAPATAKVEEHLGTFNTTTVKVLHDLGELSAQFSAHGRSLAEAVEASGAEQPAHRGIGRHPACQHRVAGHDAGCAHRRFRAASAAVLRPARRIARSATRARGKSPASSPRPATTACIPSSSSSMLSARQRTNSANAPARRSAPPTRRPPANSTPCSRSPPNASPTIMQGMKQMASEMQQELEATRTELRRGLFELPQEAAESTAQMRRVIVDQIEALAELNRIVARHGRALDAVEPMRREA